MGVRKAHDFDPDGIYLKLPVCRNRQEQNKLRARISTAIEYLKGIEDTFIEYIFDGPSLMSYSYIFKHYSSCYVEQVKSLEVFDSQKYPNTRHKVAFNKQYFNEKYKPIESDAPSIHNEFNILRILRAATGNGGY